MEQTVLSKVILPLALFIVMLGMGLSLVVDDFRRVLRFPKAFVVGLCCQLVFLPLVGLALVSLIDMGQPELAVGLMVLTFCPGGTTSNMITYLSRGDIALSISLTAVVSLICPFTIPIFTALTMSWLMGSEKAIAVPIGETVVILLAITVLPVAIGMFVRSRRSDIAARADKPVKVFSLVALAAIIAGLVKQNWEPLPGFFRDTGVPTLLLNVITMGLGFFTAKLTGLGRKQQITIAIEVGIQNGTTALMVTGTLLGNQTMMIAPAIYSLIMFATGGAFGYLVNRGRPADDDEPAPALSDG